MSSPERPNDEEPSYWTADVAIGDGRFYDDTYTIRLALHAETERYYGRSEIFPLTATTGSRVYFHAKPYILLPDIRLEVGLYPQPRGQAIGEVETVNWEGMRREVVGNAQGWFYPEERALLLWECFLHDRHRLASLLEDANHLGLRSSTRPGRTCTSGHSGNTFWRVVVTARLAQSSSAKTSPTRSRGKAASNERA